MAIVENLTPNYVTCLERTRKQMDFSVAEAQVAMVLNDLVIVASFVGLEAEAISASAVIVKVDSAGTDTAISAGDDLSGYRIAYKAGGVVAVGDSLSGALEYWNAS
jgi:hypothetical protein